MKATLRLHQKRFISDKLTLEIKLWEVERTPKYPDGIKYGLIVFDSSGKKVLMDNHSPKGHHYHLNNQEFDYIFVSINQLIKDFRSLVKIHMGAEF